MSHGNTAECSRWEGYICGHRRTSQGTHGQLSDSERGCHTSAQATKGVSECFDAVIALLAKFEYYLTRLDLRLHGPVSQQSRELTIKIFIEMLKTIALATQMMRQTRASKSRNAGRPHEF